jgi:polyisoprenoid-binding protein YceI
MRYRVHRGQVTARSGATTARSAKIAGHVDFDADSPTAAHAEISVDLRSFSTGDSFGDYQLGKQLDPAAHPIATLTVARVESIRETSAGSWSASVQAQLRWRDRQTMVRVRGKASVDRRNLDLEAGFDFDGAALGAPAGTINVQVVLFTVGFIGGDVER